MKVSEVKGLGPQRLAHLGEMPVSTFLSDYWQKKPLLIRSAFNEVPLVPADELAGYSLEDEIESRILIETPTGQPMQSQWRLHHGPFAESFYAQLPSSHWTLLVQAVDQLHPEIHQLLHRFRFIPNWRVDDIMVSYATDGGSVGPHFDYYDVFLLQAHGSRRWRLGQTCSTKSELRSDTECKILSQFEPSEDWLLHAGDMLYIPPNVAHWGIAQGECITYSVGFRAPSYGDLLLDLCQEVAANISADRRFEDSGRALNQNPGQITDEDIARVRSIVQQSLGDDQLIRDWFGRYMTHPRRQSLQFERDSGVRAVLSAQARAAYSAVDEDKAILFVNGERFSCPLSLAELICSYSPIDVTALGTAEQTLMQTLIENEWVLS